MFYKLQNSFQYTPTFLSSTAVLFHEEIKLTTMNGATGFRQKSPFEVERVTANISGYLIIQKEGPTPGVFYAIWRAARFLWHRRLCARRDVCASLPFVQLSALNQNIHRFTASQTRLSLPETIFPRRADEFNINLGRRREM